MMDCGVDVEDLDKLPHELSVLDKDGNGMVDRKEVVFMRVEESPCLLCPSLGVMFLRIDTCTVKRPSSSFVLTTLLVHTYTRKCLSAFFVLTLLVHESEQFTEWIEMRKKCH